MLNLSYASRLRVRWSSRALEDLSSPPKAVSGQVPYCSVLHASVELTGSHPPLWQLAGPAAIALPSEPLSSLSSLPMLAKLRTLTLKQKRKRKLYLIRPLLPS